MSTLLDEEGNIYEEGVLGGWRQKPGVFGTDRDVGFFGQPNVRRGAFGRPVEARDGWGRLIRGDNNRRLFEPSYDSGGYSSSSGGGDLEGVIAVFLAIGIVLIAIWVASALFAIFIKLVESVINGYRGLIKRYPRAMGVFHLSLGMIVVGLGTWLAGFEPIIQLGAVLCVPALWGWLYLTRKLPLIFMPINAVLIGAVLWFIAQQTQFLWRQPWYELTVGLPVVGRLPLILAALPMACWLWTRGVGVQPVLFRVLKRFVIGAILWFLLMRVWIAWWPYFSEWMAPVPLFNAYIGWIIFLLPIILLLRSVGQRRFPLPFVAINLLLLGAMLGLISYHTQRDWMPSWEYWMAGLPFVSIPFLTIIFAPVTLWGWNRVSRRWHSYFVLPNLLLTGVILWWVLDRTRPLWNDIWNVLWGPVPLVIDPALFFLALPLSIWLWKAGRCRFPAYWGAARALLLAGILWWLFARARPLWQDGWDLFAVRQLIDPAVLVFIVPPLIWIWVRLWRKQPRILNSIAWIILMLTLGWLFYQLFPRATPAFLVMVLLLPSLTLGWLLLIRKRPLWGWILVLLPIVVGGLILWRAPEFIQTTAFSFFTWITSQAGPLYMLI